MFYFVSFFIKIYNSFNDRVIVYKNVKCLKFNPLPSSTWEAPVASIYAMVVQSLYPQSAYIMFPTILVEVAKIIFGDHFKYVYNTQVSNLIDKRTEQCF